MKIFLFIFIMVSTFIYSQNTNYFWYDVGMPLQHLFVKMNIPDGIEYREQSNIYVYAYDFGDVTTFYVVNAGFISNVIYMKNNKSYDDINNTFLKFYNMLKDDGFVSSAHTDTHFKMNKNDIEITGNISIINTEFVLTFLVLKQTIGEK